MRIRHASNRCTENRLHKQPGTLYGAQPVIPTDLSVDGALDFLQFPGMNFDCPMNAPQVEGPRRLDYPQPLSGLNESSTNFEDNVTPQAALPADDVLMELVVLFFENVNQVFPIFHKKTFFEHLQTRRPQTEAPSLLYAICAIASRYHQDALVRNRQREWYELARFEYDLTPRDPYPSLRTIQAALLILNIRLYNW